MTDASLFSVSVAAKTNCGQHHFDEDELHAMARETRPFTRDGFAESGGRIPICLDDACFLPVRPYECTDQQGHHTWFNPPISCLRLALQHHVACKATAPTSTSMCILVPFWRQAKFRPLLKGIKCIRTYPEGTPLFTQIKGWCQRKDTDALKSAVYMIDQANRFR